MAIKSAIKYFFLSFFSNSIASESKSRSLWHGLLSFLLGVLLLFGGLTAGNAASFPSLYKQSGEFREFLYSATDNAITLEMKDGKAMATISGKKDVAIDTFTNELDATKYAKNGYNLIIDTRDEATTYNDFTLIYILNGKEYSAEDWHNISDSEKKNYSVKVNYSSTALTLTEENTSRYVSWILGEECTNNSAKESCRALLDDTGKLPKENYNAAYELYVSTYCSDLSKIERYGKAPTMRSYYMNTYLATDADGNLKHDNFVVILQNIYFCYFTTDSGTSVNTTGYFKDVADISVRSHETVDKLFLSMHNASAKIDFVNYFLYLVRVAMLAMITWLATALLISICGWIGKCQLLKEYGLAFKSYSTFWLFSGVVAALSAFAGSFFLSKTACFWVSAGIFIGFTLIRVIEQNVYVFIKYKRTLHKEEKENENLESNL